MRGLVNQSMHCDPFTWGDEKSTVDAVGAGAAWRCVMARFQMPCEFCARVNDHNGFSLSKVSLPLSTMWVFVYTHGKAA